MALSLDERKTAEALKRSGKTSSEIIRIIAKQRTGEITPQEDPTKPAPPPKESGFFAALKDIPSDISETVDRTATALKTGLIDTPSEARAQVNRGEISEGAGLTKSFGSGAAAGGRAIGETLLGFGKLFTSPATEQAVSDAVGGAAEAVVTSGPGQAVISGFQNLDPEQKAIVGGGAGIVEGAAEAFGFGPIVSRLKGVLSNAAQTALTTSDDILARSKAATTPKPSTKPASTFLQSLRYNLSEVDPQVETVLKTTNYDEVNRYFQQANNAKANPAKDTPLALAASKAEGAFDAIDGARKEAVKGKKAILERVATERVPGNTINDVIQSGLQRVGNRFGAKLEADGSISQAAGRTLQLDASDTKLISEYFSKLNALGVSPTVKQVDDFVDWAQGQLYKQSKTLSKYEVASEPVVRELQGITGDLNTRLKGVVGNGYGEVNARISRLIELQDELSNSLGADARKGAGLMKRLFSPTGDETRRIFQEIKDETGIDLVKEATLAKFAMESVGDVRQTSLLKSLDILKDSSQLDLTKPMTIINFLRENADLDGQQLANEIIRRTNASSSKQPL